MKLIIDGRTYNTETATLVARRWYKEEDSWGQKNNKQADLYMTRGGALFEVEDDSIILWPVTREEAVKSLNKGVVEKFDSSVFADPEEAGAQQEPEATIFLRVPRPLKDRIEAKAHTEGLSINAWVMRCVERCCASHAHAADALGVAHYIATSINTVPDGCTEQQCHEALQEIADEIESAWGYLGLPRQKGVDLREDVILHACEAAGRANITRNWEPYQHDSA